jgi:Flp pilus assembly protein TadG
MHFLEEVIICFSQNRRQTVRAPQVSHFVRETIMREFTRPARVIAEGYNLRSVEQFTIALFRGTPSSASSHVREDIRTRGACGRLAEDGSGAAAVEFAIVASLLLVLAMGIIAYGTYLGAAHGVAQLAADSARASIAGLTDAQRTQLAKDHVDRHVGDYFLLTRANITTEAGPMLGGDQFGVTVSFNAKDLPIWVMEGLVPLPSKTIVRTASIKRGGY